MKCTLLGVAAAAMLAVASVPAQLQVGLTGRIEAGPGNTTVLGTHHVDVLGLSLTSRVVNLSAYEGDIVRMSGDLIVIGPIVLLQVSWIEATAIRTELEAPNGMVIDEVVTWRSQAPMDSALLYMFSGRLAYNPLYGTMLDTDVGFILGARMVDATGVNILAMKIPNRPELRGVRVFSQFGCAEFAPFTFEWLNVECVVIQ